MSPGNCENVIRVKTKICDTKALLNGTVVLVDQNCEKVFQHSLSNGYYTNGQIPKEHCATCYQEKNFPTLERVNYFEVPNLQVVVKKHQIYPPKKKIKDQKLHCSNSNKCDNFKISSDEKNVCKYENVCTSDKKEFMNADKCKEYNIITRNDSVNNGVGGMHIEEYSSETASEKATRKKVKIQKRWWATADAVISGVVVCTLGVGSWRGLWGLMDLYPNLFPIWPCVFAGITIHLTFTFLRGPLHKHMSQPEASRAFQWWRVVAGRLYCWIFMCACVLQWRGQWALWAKDVVPQPQKYIPLNSQLATWTGFCALGVLKTLRNLLAMPYFVAVDTPDSTYNFYTRFRTSAREPLLFVLDCVFSVVVVGSLVVFVWRGAWDLLDYYLYPDDKVWSAWSSAIIGYGLAVLTFLLQPLARRACSKLQAARRLLLADVFLFLSFLATINVWRSVWTLLDIYFIPENPLLSNWITHAGCLLLLMLLNCANSVMVRGVYIDAEEDGGQCVVFPCYYLRLFFQKERAKKRHKRLEKAAAAVIKGADQDPGIVPLVTKLHTGNHVMVPIPEKEALTDKNSEKESL